MMESALPGGGIPSLKLKGSPNRLYRPRCDERDITLLQDKGAVTLLDEPGAGADRFFVRNFFAFCEEVLVAAAQAALGR